MQQIVKQASSLWGGLGVPSCPHVPQTRVQSLLCTPAVSTTPSLPGTPTTHYLPKTPDFLLRRGPPPLRNNPPPEVGVGAGGWVP